LRDCGFGAILDKPLEIHAIALGSIDRARGFDQSPPAM